VELDEFKILERKASTRDHCVAITRARVRAGAREVCTPVTTGSKYSLMGAEAMEGTILHVQSDDTNALAVLHDEVERKVLNEEVGVVAKTLAVERVKKSMARPVRRCGATVGLAALAVLQRLTTEGALVDFTLLRAGEGETEVLELRRK
jgi:hypothetical protein